MTSGIHSASGSIQITPPKTSADPSVNKVILVGGAIGAKPLIYSPLPNPIQDPHYTPLTRAIVENRPLNEILALANNHLNTIDPDGKTPLGRAVLKGDLKLVGALVAMGARINQVDKEFISPVFHAITVGNEEMMRLLAKLGADLDQPNVYGELLLDLAARDENVSWFEFLIELGADLDLHTEYANRKELAHVWGLSGMTKIKTKKGERTLPLLKWSLEAGATLLKGYLGAYVEQQGKFTLKEKEELQSALEHIVCDESHAVSQHRPLIIFVSSQEHATSYVITESKLYIANRGTGSNATYGVMTYKLPPQDKMEGLIKAIRAEYSTMKERNKVPSSFQLEFLPQESIPLTSQSCENCIWASCGIGSASALFAQYKKGCPNEFFNFSRKMAYDTYRKTSTNQDPKMIRDIETILTQSS